MKKKAKFLHVAALIILLLLPTLNSCKKLPDYRGTLTVTVSEVDSDYGEEIKIFPYTGAEVPYGFPVMETKIMRAPKTVSFTLNPGNYFVCYGGVVTAKAVQVQPGKETAVEF